MGTRLLARPKEPGLAMGKHVSGLGGRGRGHGGTFASLPSLAILSPSLGKASLDQIKDFASRLALLPDVTLAPLGLGLGYA